MTRRFVRFVEDLKLGHWMRKQLPRGTSLRGYNEDRAVSVLTQAVQQAIDEAGLSRKEVADLLGTTRGYISQVLSGSTNMTLKTLGALMWAAGRQVVSLQTEPLGIEHHSTPVLQFQNSATANDADNAGPIPQHSGNGGAFPEYAQAI